MTPKNFSQNGKIQPIEKANIPFSNIEYAYGYGVYESLRIRNGIVFFEKQHIDRLINSASILEIEHPFTKEIISESISNLIILEAPSTCNLKILLIGGKSPSDAKLNIFLLNPLFPDRKLYSDGMNTITYKYQRLFPNAKTLSMLGSYMAYKKAKENNCYDALLIDENKNIIEGTRTNFFAMKGKKIFTAPKEKILEGITREIVILLAKEDDYEIIEDEISINKLSSYDSAFLTSTSSKIIPVKNIDSHKFTNISDELRNLMNLYDKFLESSNGVFDF
ncbi:MAG TPA: aminotransferase class IV [Candidatus Limnocylindrales bacterium]|nr:aminotransferase class IV [Candidatus Limnocylindrales bacterium]